ncbi:MAG: HAMP domain-containing protein [Clostridia bacterium]|nr:HAMP domain-containing protein [Clostridia bacterium]
MNFKGELFRKSFIICIVLLLLATVVLLGAYTYFGRRTYISLQQESLNRTADAAQALFDNQASSTGTTFQQYLDSISKASNISYILIFPHSQENAYFFATNIVNYQENEFTQQLTERIITNGEKIDFHNITFSSVSGSIYSGRPLYVGEELRGCVLLILEIDEITGAFTRLSNSLWITALFLLPIMFLAALFLISNLLHPIGEMTKVARQLSKGNYDARIREQYRGELGMLARTMNNMSAALSRTIRQLENEKRQLGYILSSFSDGVAAIDKSGELTHFNPALMKMFGAVEVHTPIDLVPDRMIWDAFMAVMDTEEMRTFHYNLPGERVLWITIVPIMSETEGCVGAVGLFKDATEIEQLERMRNEYVANISHELRTPLTSIRGLLEPLCDGMVKNEETRNRYYSIMLHEVERLSRLITDMLQLSRLQSGTENMNITLFDVNELLDDVTLSLMPEAKKRNCRIEVETKENLPSVMSDRDRIEQVLVILIDNAMRYAKSTVKLIVDDDPHDVFISVWDDGCGIKKEDMARLFERFYKVDKSRKEGGNGLGLSIAKQIMEKLDERLEVDSEEGKWTCFRITIKKYVSNAIPLNSVEEIVS